MLPIILLFCLLLSSLGLPALALEEPELSSSYAVLMDADSGRIFYQKDADAKAYPASLTKVMTVLVAVEAVERGEFSLTDSVTASDTCLEGMVDDGSTAGIVPGETMPLQDLLYCALLASANEACNVIAEYIGGSVDAFVEMMIPAPRSSAAPAPTSQTPTACPMRTTTPPPTTSPSSTARPSPTTSSPR